MASAEMHQHVHLELHFKYLRIGRFTEGKMLLLQQTLLLYLPFQATLTAPAVS